MTCADICVEVRRSRPQRRVRHEASVRPGRAAGLVSGWLLVLAGLALIPLPGPGSIVAIAGLRQLAPHHRWAARMYEPAQARVLQAAQLGVATWPRVAFAALGPVWLAALTAAYAAAVTIPTVQLAGLTVGPSLPFQSTGTTIGLAASVLASAVLVVASVAAWGPRSRAARAEV